MAHYDHKLPRPKKCKVCGNKFQPTRSIQPTCENFDCKLAYGVQAAKKSKATRARKEAREHREAKVRAKPRSKWMQEAQAAFNRWIRLRDAGQPCISCGRHHQGQHHAGHYRSTKAAPELRFEENNVHLQCQPCNTHLSGNIVEYRKSLIQKIGLLGFGGVEWLEGPHEPKHYTIEDLKAIKEKYTAMAKALDGK